MQDYSQNGEQLTILGAVGDRMGRFIDIGACDGRMFSNTLALIECGWSGVMIEPSYRAFAALHERHGANPKITLVHAAVGPELAVNPFWALPWVDGLDTTEDVIRHKRATLAWLPPYFIGVIPLRAVLAAFPGPVDVLNIDTEGTSVDLLLAFPFGDIQPTAVCVEHDGRIDECRGRLIPFGYSVVKTNPENLVLVKR